jgi:hypothetical protein
MKPFSTRSSADSIAAGVSCRLVAAIPWPPGWVVPLTSDDHVQRVASCSRRAGFPAPSRFLPDPQRLWRTELPRSSNIVLIAGGDVPGGHIPLSL